MKATLSILFLALAAVAAAAAPGPARLGGSLPKAGTGKPPLPLAPRQASRVVQVPDLHWAAFAGDLAEVRRLLREGASVTATETLWGGEHPLHWAAIGGNPLVVRELLAAGAPIEGRDAGGETALQEALRGHDPGLRALQALLAAGANPEHVSFGGWRPLHEAASLPSDRALNAVLTLRWFGADPTAPFGSRKATALHLAALQPYDRFAGRALLNPWVDPNGRVADSNAQDQNGQTPLHWLVVDGRSAQDRRVALWLVQNGADPHLGDVNGDTPIQLARLMGADELARLLESAAPPQPEPGDGE